MELRAKHRSLIVGIALAALAVPFSSGARAASWFEMNFYLSGPRYDGVIPGCEAGLGTIASRFAAKEGRFWNSSLTIEAFTDVRELSYRPWAAHSIPRRFCRAVAIIGGHRHQVYYSINEDTGFIGSTWGVEWCVVGYDRNLAYNPRCKMAQP